MIPWPVPLATIVGFHKPRVGPSNRSDSPLRGKQGGTLVSSARESARAGLHAPPSRRPAVVGLAAPPYGLPSTDPTTRPSAVVTLRVTPVPSVQSTSAAAAVSTVPAAPSRQLAKRGWSAHADNRPRSAFPLDLLPSRGRPLRRPRRSADDHLLPRAILLSSVPVVASWRARL